jgi:uncharacterized membrane protein (UPF0127 family)
MTSMSKTKRMYFAGSILILIAAAACLLYLYQSKSVMSDRVPVAASSTIPSSAVPATASATQTSISTVPISTTTAITFEVVTTPTQQARGLGGRKVIPDNYGMLFVFKQDLEPGFWMKDMLTSIDMIWLTDNGTIAGITTNVSPSTYPDVFYPPQPIRYVLETRVGLASSRGWKVGTKVPLPTPYGTLPLPYGK